MNALLSLVLLLCFATTAAAQPTPAPDVLSIMRRMKAAIEPAQPSVRSLEIVLRDTQGVETRWTARQARKAGPNGGRIAMVMTSPADIAGAAFLIAEQPHGADLQWEYLPSVRRVRKIVPIGAFHPLLGTDFTYGDLGFVDLDLQSAALLGTETLPDGVQVYRIEERPKNQWYYSRIVDLVATNNSLPVRREFFTPANELEKVEIFESVTTIDGIPTPLVVRMEDRMGGGSTEVRAEDVRYGADIPEDLFEPTGLPHLLDHAMWRAGS